MPAHDLPNPLTIVPGPFLPPLSQNTDSVETNPEESIDSKNSTSLSVQTKVKQLESDLESYRTLLSHMADTCRTLQHRINTLESEKTPSTPTLPSMMGHNSTVSHVPNERREAEVRRRSWHGHGQGYGSSGGVGGYLLSPPSSPRGSLSFAQGTFGMPYHQKQQTSPPRQRYPVSSPPQSQSFVLPPIPEPELGSGSTQSRCSHSSVDLGRGGRGRMSPPMLPIASTSSTSSPTRVLGKSTHRPRSWHGLLQGNGNDYRSQYSLPLSRQSSVSYYGTLSPTLTQSPITTQPQCHCHCGCYARSQDTAFPLHTNKGNVEVDRADEEDAEYRIEYDDTRLLEKAWLWF
ncbi:hypothetical protein ABKN59_002670 [Abortiporus biennis]